MIRNLLLSVLCSILVLLFSYVLTNTSFPLPDEMRVLQWFDKGRSISGLNHDNVPDSILMVNVCFDKQLVDYSENGMRVGSYVVTDRQKLLQFLTLAHQANNYRYIMFDVVFEQGMQTPYDKELFNLISRMPRIVVANHKDVVLQDSILLKKAANADYTTTWEETNFTRFQFLNRMGEESIPLYMFRELTGKTITRYGPFYFCGGLPCHGAITLQHSVRVSGSYVDNGERFRTKNYVYLGAELLDDNLINPVADQIDGKIVVVGDFQNDRHETYMGPQPGAVICTNAYIALCQGQHYVNWWFFLFTFLLYVLIAYLRLQGFEPNLPSPWLRVLFYLFSVPILLLIIAVLVYWWFGIVYNLFIPTFVYWALDGISNMYIKFKGTK
jgi:hypothetical protein